MENIELTLIDEIHKYKLTINIEKSKLLEFEYFEKMFTNNFKEQNSNQITMSVPNAHLFFELLTNNFEPKMFTNCSEILAFLQPKNKGTVVCSKEQLVTDLIESVNTYPSFVGHLMNQMYHTISDVVNPETQTKIIKKYFKKTDDILCSVSEYDAIQLSSVDDEFIYLNIPYKSKNLKHVSYHEKYLVLFYEKILQIFNFCTLDFKNIVHGISFENIKHIIIDTKNDINFICLVKSNEIIIYAIFESKLELMHTITAYNLVHSIIMVKHYLYYIDDNGLNMYDITKKYLTCCPKIGQYIKICENSILGDSCIIFGGAGMYQYSFNENKIVLIHEFKLCGDSVQKLIISDDYKYIATCGNKIIYI